MKHSRLCSDAYTQTGLFRLSSKGYWFSVVIKGSVGLGAWRARLFFWCSPFLLLPTFPSFSSPLPSPLHLSPLLPPPHLLLLFFPFFLLFFLLLFISFLFLCWCLGRKPLSMLGEHPTMRSMSGSDTAFFVSFKYPCLPPCHDPWLTSSPLFSPRCAVP